MKALQAYLFRQGMVPLLAILGGLAGVAILTQGLNQLDLIVDQRQSALAFIWVTLLSMPQLISLIMPLAVFFAVTYAVNRMHTESEIAVAFAAGVSPWQIVSPILKLASVAALAHLAVNVLIQPASYREMRETVHAMRSDFAASLVRAGEFTTPADGLTFYAREVGAGGVLRDLFIDDRRNTNRPTTYTARFGLIRKTPAGIPAVVMQQGQIQQPKPDGSVDLLDFDQYTLELGAFVSAEDDYVLKPSDRFLAELFFPDLIYYYDQRNADRFLAEGHHRLSSPLLDPALALIALAGLLAGDFSRRGYGQRIAVAAAAALTVRIFALGIQAACVDEPALNPLQYVFPLAVSVVAFWMLQAPRKPAQGPAAAGLTMAR
ncbi:MAG: LPS export ABC transporter permease LptF [Hyphomonadaceae bacterium]|nr:MAG: lipopolysaccharide export system permease protein [Caulobacteraceae bacterium]MBT9445155.1 LPS export ABC transporter permease LptF [Hyphomonadaceae bacterium]